MVHQDDVGLRFVVQLDESIANKLPGVRRVNDRRIQGRYADAEPLYALASSRPCARLFFIR